MAKISSYQLSGAPLSLSDMLIGTEVGAAIPLVTKNFSLGQLLTFFNSQNPANNLQNVLNTGNTATQNINLIGDIQATNAEFETLYLTDEFLDSTGNPGTAGDILISTGGGVIWGPGGGGSTYVFQNGLQQNGSVVTLGGSFTNPAICSDDIYIISDVPNANYFVVGDFYTQIYNGGANLFVSNGSVTASFGNGVSNASYVVSDDGTFAYVRIGAQEGFSNGSYAQAKGKEIEFYSTDGTYKIGNLPPVENTTTNLDLLTIDTTSFLIKRTDISSIISGTVTSVGITAGVGISLSGTNPITSSGNITVTNSAPDQVVALTPGSGIGITGTYPNFTITNSSPNQPITLTEGSGIDITGSDPNFTITNSAPDLTVTLTQGSGIAISGTYPNFTIAATGGGGTVTSVGLTAGAGILLSGTNPITSSGSITITNNAPDQIVTLSPGTGIGITGSYPNFTITNSAPNQVVSLTQGSGITITGTYPNFTIAATGGGGSGTVTSVGLSMPSAFTVTNTPITTSGTLTVTGAGTASQYIRGDGQLANFPSNGGGGSSVNYFLNGSVNQGTIGGDTYYEMSKVPVFGTGTNFTRTNAAGNGYIASFITDAGDPSLLNIPGGNWNLEFYFNASSGGGSPSFYAEIYKVSSTNVFTLVGSGSTNPEGITQGTVVDQYFTSVPVPQTSLLITDRLAIRIYVITGGRDITLHTEDNNLCQIITTFSTGLNALNGLTSQVQFFQVGTSGTDFGITPSVDTHTFNLPVASATNTGKLSSANWTTFNNKQNAVALTTSGSSGVATFNPTTGALNIPQYGGSGGSGFGYTVIMGFNVTTLTASTTFVSGAFYGSGAVTLANDRPSRWLLIPKDGTVTSVSVIAQLSDPGALASPISSTMDIQLIRRGTAATTPIDATFPIGSNLSWSTNAPPTNPRAYNKLYNQTSTPAFTPFPVFAGDSLQIRMTTPAWSTAPSAISMQFILFIE
jgi:hypothetical protein